MLPGKDETLLNDDLFDLSVYDDMNEEQLYKEAKKIIKNKPINLIKEVINKIDDRFCELIQIDRKNKEESFVSSGGEIHDFKFNNEINNKFIELMFEYRSAKKKYFEEIRIRQEKNLEKKIQIIKSIKELYQGTESVPNAIEKFKLLQEEWTKYDDIPKSKANEIWNKYKHHTKNFYDYTNLNRQLRQVNTEKNLELRTKVINSARELLNETSIKKMSTKIDLLHNIWKNEIGSVGKTDNDKTWEEFSEISSQIREKISAHFDEIKIQNQKSIDKKRQLCKDLEALVSDTESLNTHNKWQKKNAEVEYIFTEFKKTKRAFKKEEENIWEKFIGLKKRFDKNKNDFYKSLKKRANDQLPLKRELLEKAIAIVSSEDTSKTIRDIKEIQRQWNGLIRSKSHEKIDKNFQGICNDFFGKLKEKRDEFENISEETIGIANAVIEQTREYDNKEDISKEQDEPLLKNLIKKWEKLGETPVELTEKFYLHINSILLKMGFNQKEITLIRFKEKIMALSEIGKTNDIKKEHETIKKSTISMEKEIQQLEINLSFFKNSDNDFAKEVKKSLQDKKESLDLLKKKMSFLKKNNFQ
ncbi:DUF349 domain-containing protein [Ichthyobacterium seriolicida]|uniref:Chromosome segregation protein n=1 Tax=Ichthyobacterium seriolicida TaxID=242600 RepID=A0A1J1E817_9FLAO|nr:DUF349 domain-containing protein [Ichthyobacterium seriolicida]BAV95486.1 hypothetical protein JBKA6_1473 [Ichthyobacterium seriolicida]